MCVGTLFSAQNVLKNSKLRVTAFISQIRNLIKDLLSLRKEETEETLGGHGRKWRSEGKILSMSKKDKVGQRQNVVIPWDVKTLNFFCGMFKDLVFLLRETTYREHKPVSKKTRLEELFRSHLVQHSSP